MYRRIVLPVHGGELDRRAIELATMIGGRSGKAELTLVYVVEFAQKFALDADLPDAVEEGERILEEANGIVRSMSDRRWHRVTTELLQARSAAAAIVDEAIERSADVIVLTTTTQRRWGVVSYGEIVPYILMNAPCEVVLLRALTEGGQPT